MPYRISMPMYRVCDDGAVSVWLAGLKDHLEAAGIPAPVEIIESVPSDPGAHWRDPELLLSQTCGYPYAAFLKNQLTVVATPAYDVADFRAGYYKSRIIVNAGDGICDVQGLRHTTVAINDPESNSGAIAWQRLLGGPEKAFSFFTNCRYSGSHLASVEMVAAGEADCAAIDGVTFALISRCRPELAASVRIVADSPESPGLPFVTSVTIAGQVLDQLRLGLANAFIDEALEAARRLQLLEGLVELPVDAYDFLGGWPVWSKT